MDIEDVEVFVGIDVGKAEHWATALTAGGKKLFDKALPNDESRLRDLYERLGEHGRVLVVVDQPATIGALAVAVAQVMDITVGYLPGLSMRRIADLTPGSAKTDAKDAAVIADAARTMPHTLRSISTSDEDAAALSMLTGFGPGPGPSGPARPRGRIRGPCAPRSTLPSRLCWASGSNTTACWR
ncbi:Possible transposase [Actinomyces succiniciruminis]|uniref:Possible transposase n=1 Tax=Actinomyces succiniciruminis TaxID=1522002 RepID=A0A1L7RQK5_9ACTO|nr:Possible transposase [Actinomyces succiniciruminis]